MTRVGWLLGVMILGVMLGSWSAKAGTDINVQILEGWTACGPKYNAVTVERSTLLRIVDNGGNELFTVDPKGQRLVEAGGRLFLQRKIAAVDAGQTDHLELTLLDERGQPERVFTTDLARMDGVSLIASMNLLAVYAEVAPAVAGDKPRLLLRTYAFDSAKAIAGQLPDAIDLPATVLCRDDGELIWLVRSGTKEDGAYWIAEAYDRKLARRQQIRLWGIPKGAPVEKPNALELEACGISKEMLFCVARHRVGGEKEPSRSLALLDVKLGEPKYVELTPRKLGESKIRIACAAAVVLLRGDSQLVAVDTARASVGWTFPAAPQAFGPTILEDETGLVALAVPEKARKRSTVRVIDAKSGLVRSSWYVDFTEVSSIKTTSGGKVLLVFGPTKAVRITLSSGEVREVQDVF